MSHKQTLFAIVENFWPNGFLMHGVFDTLEGAVSAYQDLKSKNIILNREQDYGIIEEFPINAPLDYAFNFEDTHIKTCIAKYTLDGKLIVKKQVVFHRV